MPPRDKFKALTAADVNDAALLVGRFDALRLEVGEIRGMVERLLVAMTAAIGDSREIRHELASIVELIGKLHASLEARADAANVRLDALEAEARRHAADIEALKRWRDALPPPRIATKRRRAGSSG